MEDQTPVEVKPSLEKELVADLGIEAKEAAEIVTVKVIKSLFIYADKKIDSLDNPSFALVKPFLPMVEKILLALADKIDGQDNPNY